MTYNECMEQWVWTGIRGYWVSDEGRVARRNGGREWILRPGKNSRGYMMVQINLEGTRGSRKARTVHSLVLEAFVGPRPTPRHQGNHKDGDRANNGLRNLEWVTPSENVRHAIDILGRKWWIARGEKSGRAKLTEGSIQEIRALLAAGEQKAGIARGYGVKPEAIRAIETGETWGWLAVQAPKRSIGELLAKIPRLARKGVPKIERTKPPSKDEIAEQELSNALRTGVRVTFTPYVGATGNWYTRQDTGERCSGVARRLIHSGRAHREGVELKIGPSAP